MTKQTIEFLYKGIQINIFQRFGWAYSFMFNNQEYYSNGDYVFLDGCKEGAREHIDRVCNRNNYRDEMGMNV